MIELSNNRMDRKRSGVDATRKTAPLLWAIRNRKSPDRHQFWLAGIGSGCLPPVHKSTPTTRSCIPPVRDIAGLKAYDDRSPDADPHNPVMSVAANLRGAVRLRQSRPDHCKAALSRLQAPEPNGSGY